MTPSRRRFLMLAALFSLGVSTLCYGRVFSRWRSSRHAAEALDAQGGKSVYETGFTHQGHRGMLGTFMFDGAVSDALRQIAKAFPGAKTVFRNEQLGQMSWTDNEVTLSWLAIGTESSGKTVVFQTERASAEQESAVPEMPAGIPAYPNGRNLFTARMDADGTALATASTIDAPAAVDRFYESHLSGHGWMRAFPPSTGESRMGVYLHRNNMCIVLAGRDFGDNETRIAVLHKPQGLK